ALSRSPARGSGGRPVGCRRGGRPGHGKGARPGRRRRRGTSHGVSRRDSPGGGWGTGGPGRAAIYRLARGAGGGWEGGGGPAPSEVRRDGTGHRRGGRPDEDRSVVAQAGSAPGRGRPGAGGGGVLGDPLRPHDGGGGRERAEVADHAAGRGGDETPYGAPV